MDIGHVSVYRLFAPFGAVVSIDLKPSTVTEESEAYVHFRFLSDAIYMLEQMDLTTLCGKPLFATLLSPRNQVAAGA